jgi:hypothetical protein
METTRLFDDTLRIALAGSLDTIMSHINYKRQLIQLERPTPAGKC